MQKLSLPTQTPRPAWILGTLYGPVKVEERDEVRALSSEQSLASEVLGAKALTGGRRAEESPGKVPLARSS